MFFIHCCFYLLIFCKGILYSSWWYICLVMFLNMFLSLLSIVITHFSLGTQLELYIALAINQSSLILLVAIKEICLVLKRSIMRHIEQSLVGSILAKAQTCQESSLEKPAQLTSLLTAHTWMSPAEISQAGIRSVGPPSWHINLEEWEMFILSHKL